MCYSKHYATTLQDEEDATAKNIGGERSYPRGHHIEWQDQSSTEGSPSWEPEPCGWEEKEETKQQDFP